MAEKKPTVFKSYLKVFSDEKNPRFLLVWHEMLGKYTFPGSSPGFSKMPLTKEEAAHEDYRFGTEALKAAEKKLGYEGGLLRAGKVVEPELKDKDNVGIDQWAVLEFFRPDRPISGKALEGMAEKYRKTHSDEPQPLVLTAAQMAERDDVYHVVVETAKKGEILKKK
jgi:hypothetical protein